MNYPTLLIASTLLGQSVTLAPLFPDANLQHSFVTTNTWFPPVHAIPSFREGYWPSNLVSGTVSSNPVTTAQSIQITVTYPSGYGANVAWAVISKHPTRGLRIQQVVGGLDHDIFIPDAAVEAFIQALQIVSKESGK